MEGSDKEKKDAKSIFPEAIESFSIHEDGYSDSASTAYAISKKVSHEYTEKNAIVLEEKKNATLKQTHSATKSNRKIHYIVASSECPIDVGFDIHNAVVEKQENNLLLHLTENTIVIYNYFNDIHNLPTIVFSGTVLLTGEEFLCVFAHEIYAWYRNISGKNRTKAKGAMDKLVKTVTNVKRTLEESKGEIINPSTFWKSLSIIASDTPTQKEYHSTEEENIAEKIEDIVGEEFPTVHIEESEDYQSTMQKNQQEDSITISSEQALYNISENQEENTYMHSEDSILPDKEYSSSSAYFIEEDIAEYEDDNNQEVTVEYITKETQEDTIEPYPQEYKDTFYGYQQEENPVVEHSSSEYAIEPLTHYEEESHYNILQESIQELHNTVATLDKNLHSLQEQNSLLHKTEEDVHAIAMEVQEVQKILLSVQEKMHTIEEFNGKEYIDNTLQKYSTYLQEELQSIRTYLQENLPKATSTIPVDTMPSVMKQTNNVLDVEENSFKYSPAIPRIQEILSILQNDIRIIYTCQNYRDTGHSTAESIETKLHTIQQELQNFMEGLPLFHSAVLENDASNNNIETITQKGTFLTENLTNIQSFLSEIRQKIQDVEKLKTSIDEYTIDSIKVNETITEMHANIHNILNNINNNATHTADASLQFIEDSLSYIQSVFDTILSIEDNSPACTQIIQENIEAIQEEIAKIHNVIEAVQEYMYVVGYNALQITKDSSIVNATYTNAQYITMQEYIQNCLGKINIINNALHVSSQNKELLTTLQEQIQYVERELLIIVPLIENNIENTVQEHIVENSIDIEKLSTDNNNKIIVPENITHNEQGFHEPEERHTEKYISAKRIEAQGLEFLEENVTSLYDTVAELKHTLSTLQNSVVEIKNEIQKPLQENMLYTPPKYTNTILDTWLQYLENIPKEYTNGIQVVHVECNGVEEHVDTQFSSAYGHIFIGSSGAIQYEPKIDIVYEEGKTYVDNFVLTVKNANANHILLYCSIHVKIKNATIFATAQPVISKEYIESSNALSLEVEVKNPSVGDTLYFEYPLPQNIHYTAISNTHNMLENITSINDAEELLQQLCIQINPAMEHERYINIQIVGYIAGIRYNKSYVYGIIYEEGITNYTIVMGKSLSNEAKPSFFAKTIEDESIVEEHYDENMYNENQEENSFDYNIQEYDNDSEGIVYTAQENDKYSIVQSLENFEESSEDFEKSENTTQDYQENNNNIEKIKLKILKEEDISTIPYEYMEQEMLHEEINKEEKQEETTYPTIAIPQEVADELEESEHLHQLQIEEEPEVIPIYIPNTITQSSIFLEKSIKEYAESHKLHVLHCICNGIMHSVDSWWYSGYGAVSVDTHGVFSYGLTQEVAQGLFYKPVYDIFFCVIEDEYAEQYTIPIAFRLYTSEYGTVYTQVDMDSIPEEDIPPAQSFTVTARLTDNIEGDAILLVETYHKSYMYTKNMQIAKTCIASSIEEVKEFVGSLVAYIPENSYPNMLRTLNLTIEGYQGTELIFNTNNYTIKPEENKTYYYFSSFSPVSVETETIQEQQAPASTFMENSILYGSEEEPTEIAETQTYEVEEAYTPLEDSTHTEDIYIEQEAIEEYITQEIEQSAYTEQEEPITEEYIEEYISNENIFTVEDALLCRRSSTRDIRLGGTFGDTIVLSGEGWNINHTPPKAYVQGCIYNMYSINSNEGEYIVFIPETVSVEYREQ